MKKRRNKIILVVLLVFLIVTPFAMRVAWEYSDIKSLNVLILDKTVLNPKCQEHLSFNWLLNYNNYVKPDELHYLLEKDYFGFFPDGEGDYYINDLENKSSEELERMADEYDMVYFTDLYGIYTNDWLNEYPQVNPEQKRGKIGESSQLIYGGLTKTDLEFLELMKNRDKLIINEFNIIASPTSTASREAYEEMFDIKWSGWVGRYFNNLDSSINKELPQWLLKNYMKQNINQWPFKNSGIAFVRDENIVILENERHLLNEVPFIHTDELLAKNYKLAKEIKYPFWFDICSTGDKNEVFSNYRIEANAKGDSILEHWNIPNEFPAVIKSKEKYPYYYFAGDFADNPISMNSAKYKFVTTFNFLFYQSEVNERNSFFWKYYNPLIEKILKDYYIDLNYSE